ncbi:MAG: DASS family sodium-coupled anion symporter, partial [Anaerolineae bacterium]|nr:DASS family sodium-coupled anion symporter [Anaerolineae bacterium]
NTASVAIIIPIGLAILDKISNDNISFHKALILGVAYAGAIGGIGSAIGTPANMLALTFLSDFAETTLTFNDWFAYGLPMVLIMVPVIWLYLFMTFKVSSNAQLDRSVYEAELKQVGQLNSKQKLIFAVFAVVMALWLTESLHGIHSSIVALGGALVLFFAEILEKEDLRRINWDALLTFGGGLSIGSLLVTTGVSDWVALKLIGLVVLPQIVVIFLLAALTMITGAFISNTACAAMLIPLAIPLARILQIDPRLLVAIIAISSSIDFALVVGTPPTMMAYSTGYFKTTEIFKRGVVLDIIGVTILSLGVIWIWKLLGVVTF